MFRFFNILSLVIILASLVSARVWVKHTKENSGLAGNMVKAVCAL